MNMESNPMEKINACAPTKCRALQVGLVALLVFALDQLSKYWVVVVVGMQTRPPVVLNEYMSLVMAWNRGVSFSMFSHESQVMPYVLTLLAVVVSAILARLALKSERRWERIGYAMVIGGALGNALDRLRHGAVADFLYVHVGALGWPAFNVADSGICIGVGLLLICLVKHPARP
ncbi:MAG: signal peptidase II [Pseudomonadota bacterium]